MNVNSPSNANSQESVTFKNIPPAAEVVEFKKPEAVSTHVEKENRTALETLSVKEPSDSKKTKRNEEKNQNGFPPSLQSNRAYFHFKLRLLRKKKRRMD